MTISKPKYYDWKRRVGEENKHNGIMPKDSWILDAEKQAIVEYFLAHPLNGCKRLSYMMIDEDVAYVSHNTVYRVLKSEGLLTPKSGKSSLKGTGFDQPKQPHEQWHIDISYINAGGTFYYLASVLDGYSRFIVDWTLKESLTNEDCQMLVQKAKESFGGKKTRVISDNGPQFKAKQFKSFLKMSGMDQTFTSPYYPQSNGKIERWHKELKTTCIRPKQPRNFKEAKDAVAGFIEDYNYCRLHSAIGYVTPFDKLLGTDTDLHVDRKNKLDKARELRKKIWASQKQVAESIPA